MLEVWASLGYILLLAIAIFGFVLWRKGGALASVLSVVVGLALLTWWEYARPTWTTGTVIGTEVRRSETDKAGLTRDVEYIYMRNQSDAGVELENDDFWWWFKRNSSRVFNDAQTAADRKSEVTVMWNRWRSTLFSWYPNVIAIGEAGSWPLWSWRTLTFYGLSLFVWLGYFLGFTWLYRRTHKFL